MARKRTTSRSTASRSRGGSTFFGILIGLILGLAAAVAVALFVTQVPMPFVDRASRDPAQTLLPDVRNAPDPNLGLYGLGQAAADGGQAATPPAPDGSPPTAVRSGDSLGEFIAGLAGSDRAAPPADSARPSTGRPSASAPSATAPSATVPGVTEPSSPAPAPAADRTQYYLQAGAFRSATDADAVKARILLMGLPARVEQAQVGGSTINRVRVGPFDGIDAMNRARAQLGSEKIDSSVVRQ